MAPRIWLVLFVLGIGCEGSSPTADGGSGPSDGDRADAPSADAAPADAAGRTDGGGPAACALPAPFDVGVTYERTLHVAVSGAPENDGSEASPLDSIETAAARATPGTRILVHAGRYEGGQTVENLAGEAGRPIAIVGEDGAVLDAAGAGEVLHLSEIAYVVLENLVLVGGTANGLNIDDGGTYDTPSHHLVLRDLDVRDVGSGGNNDCIKLSGVDDYFVLGTRIAHCDGGDMIDHVGCHRGLIHGNTFDGTAGSGGIQMKGGSADIVVHGNRFLDVDGRAINAGGSTGLEFFRPIDAPYEAARLTIVANLFERSGSDSIVAFVGCDACVFQNNTISEPRGWIARVLQESTDARFVPSRNGIFANNVILFRVADVRANEYNVGAGTAPETFTFGTNLWWALDDPSYPGPNADGPGISETGSLVGVDPGGTVIQLLYPCIGTPADGAGRALPAATPDLLGECFGSPPAIGAFEANWCFV